MCEEVPAVVLAEMTGAGLSTGPGGGGGKADGFGRCLGTSLFNLHITQTNQEIYQIKSPCVVFS